MSDFTNFPMALFIGGRSKEQKHQIYATENDRKKIEAEKAPITLQAMQTLSALLRFHNERVQVLGLKT